VSEEANTDVEALEKHKWIVVAAAVVAIGGAAAKLLAGTGVLAGTDNLQGYYQVKVNPVAAGSPNMAGDMVFGFERLALNDDHTFRLGFLRGNWHHHGAIVTLEPTALPTKEQFYPQTTMVDTLSILLKPADFRVSTDGKTLTAAKPTGGPLIFVKSADGLR